MIIDTILSKDIINSPEEIIEYMEQIQKHCDANNIETLVDLNLLSKIFNIDEIASITIEEYQPQERSKTINTINGDINIRIDNDRERLFNIKKK